MSLTSSRVTRIVDSLVRKKLVIREIGAADRRIYNLYLTPRGKSLAIDLIDSYCTIHEQILNKIPTNQRQQMIENLHRLNEAVENWLFDK